MPGWFTANATQIITASSTLIGVGFSGLITYFVNKENAKSTREARDNQNNFEKWKTNREFYINKAEELFSLFDKWHENLYQVYLLTLARTTGAKTDAQVREEWDVYVDKTIQPRITALLTLYYADLVSDFKEVCDANSEIMTSYAMVITQKISPSDYNISALTNIELIRQKSLAFKEKLALLTQAHL